MKKTEPQIEELNETDAILSRTRKYRDWIRNSFSIQGPPCRYRYIKLMLMRVPHACQCNKDMVDE